MRSSAKEHRSPKFEECFFAVRWLIYTVRNVVLRSSSVSFPPLWTQLRKLNFELQISSVPSPNSFISCFCLSRQNDVNSESISSPAFRCLAISQSADFFLGIVLRNNLWNEFVGFHEHFPSLYSDINISTVTSDHSMIKSERQWEQREKLNYWTRAGIAQSVWRRAGQTCFDSQRRKKICLFFTASRQALGPIQSPIWWVPGVKWPGHEADHASQCCY
jgi:hypothetical protein